jgi:SAM-dependent methyltransferase
VQFDDKILDVGCGNGGLLKSLNRIGFTNLTGIDPFNDKDLFFGDIKIYKKDLFKMVGKYDFIMLNHVLEHLDEPQRIVKKLYDLLNNGRYLLIRTPVMNTYAWDTYNTDWMSLDAPRHLIIHTIKSIQLLCDMTGFKLDDVVFDSTEDGLVGSEQYKKDVALTEPGSFFSNRKTALFSKEEIDDLKKISKEKNINRDGDQAAFYLYKP